MRRPFVHLFKNYLYYNIMKEFFNDLLVTIMRAALGNFYISAIESKDNSIFTIDMYTVKS